jgi:hypothetical protein
VECSGGVAARGARVDFFFLRRGPRGGRSFSVLRPRVSGGLAWFGRLERRERLGGVWFAGKGSG